MSSVINYSGEDFENETVSQTGLTLVDFYAIWCGPCQMLEKVLVEVSKNSNCKIVRIDVDDYPEFGSKFKIRGLPTLILFKEGKIVETLNGFKTFDEIMEKINLHN
jgi:thioredoxin domain protein